MWLALTLTMITKNRVYFRNGESVYCGWFFTGEIRMYLIRVMKS